MFLFSQNKHGQRPVRKEDFRQTPHVYFEANEGNLESWNKHIGLLPTDLYEDLYTDKTTDLGLELSFHSDDNASLNLSLLQNLVPYTSCSVSLDFRRQTAYLNLLHADHQKAGAGRNLTAALYKLCSKLNFHGINLETEDVGGYFWAKVGFLPSIEGWHILRQELSEKLQTQAPYLSQNLQKTISDILAKEDPSALWEIADLKQTGKDTHQFIGKTLLLNTEWRGHFSFFSEDQKSRLEQYIASPHVDTKSAKNSHQKRRPSSPSPS